MAVFGILFALIALFGWAFGDFLIQRSTRHIGVWRTRLVLNGSAAIVLFPFVQKEMGSLGGNPTLAALLVGLCILSLFGGYFGLQALKSGKLAVIEPINGLELPFTVVLSIALLHEALSLLQFGCIVLIFAGIMLTVMRRLPTGKRRKLALEKGTAYAIIGVFGLGMVNLTIGLTSRMSSPLFVSWSTGSFIAVVCLLYLLITRRLSSVPALIVAHGRELFLVCLIGNASWISFAYATTFLPISIATAITEAYIALGVLLGVVVNRERLRPHQIVGVVCALIGVISLAAVTG